MLCHNCGYTWSEGEVIQRGGDAVTRCPRCGAINLIQLGEARHDAAKLANHDTHPYRRPFPLGPSTRPIPSPIKISTVTPRGTGYNPEQKGVHCVVRRY